MISQSCSFCNFIETALSIFYQSGSRAISEAPSCAAALRRAARLFSGHSETSEKKREREREREREELKRAGEAPSEAECAKRWGQGQLASSGAFVPRRGIEGQAKAEANTWSTRAMQEPVSLCPSMSLHVLLCASMCFYACELRGPNVEAALLLAGSQESPLPDSIV